MNELIKQMAAQKKITLLENEEVIIQGMSSYLKSRLNVVSGYVYLTNYRMVFCCKRTVTAVALFGVVGAITSLVRKQTKITFQIPIAEIESIKLQKHFRSRKHTIMSNNKEFAVQLPVCKEWESHLSEQGVIIENCINN